MVEILLIVITIFLALNMGASGFSVSFACSYGSGSICEKNSYIFYTLFLLLGAIIVGPRVVDTLVNKLTNIKDLNSAFLILLAASITMFLSNLSKIPQSTSLITVSSFVGAGLFYNNVIWKTFLKIIGVALVFSFLSFISTYFIGRKIFPLKNENLKFYEKAYIHNRKLENFMNFVSFYKSFAIGTNNVANVVAPFLLIYPIKPLIALGIFAPFFGIGSYLLGKGVLNTISKEVVPLGKISGTIVSSVSSTFVIIASLLGFPTPYVQFTTFSILGISSLKDGKIHTFFEKKIVKKIFFVWLLLPVMTIFLSYILHFLLIKK